MLKRFIQNYIWFWEKSFSYMRGHSRVKIAVQCIYKGVTFAIDMEKWHREENKLLTYALMNRTIRF